MTSRPNEFPFVLGLTRVYVTAEVQSAQPVYLTDGAIRITREALLGQYGLVLREVVRLTRLAPAYVDTVLHAVRHRISEPDPIV